MTLSFDLISDLHVDTWPDTFNWSLRATSPYCIVAGDVARDRRSVINTLRHLGQCYQGVFYIDGNDEHVNHWDDFEHSYRDLAKKVQRLSNVVYLQDNVVVVNGVAIVATNGWWAFDFDPEIDAEQAVTWYQEKWQGQVSKETVENMIRLADTEAAYIINSIGRLQTHVDVKRIVVVTHTVPSPDLIRHDVELDGSYRFNCMGNSVMMNAIAADVEQKIHTWCFGHYHGSVDQLRQGIRFVNNCRGRGNTQYSQWTYHPLRVAVDV
jgi:hypothetical protein